MPLENTQVLGSLNLSVIKVDVYTALRYMPRSVEPFKDQIKKSNFIWRVQKYYS